ncbi:MAG: PadR family transcriptional regulator [Bacteroidales bacterium]|jgi:PadR family transcriptional regulator PadR|nr:PadR family transcriptional regulator [Bacteroidales bacterium]
MEVINNSDNVKSQMRKGILEYCILGILNKKDSYASSIITELKEARMIVVEGTLYPLLIRQKNQGLLTYRWEESTQGPPRKYYSITEKGRAQLAEMDTVWREMVETINLIRR